MDVIAIRINIDIVTVAITICIPRPLDLIGNAVSVAVCIGIVGYAITVGIDVIARQL